jgi:2,4-dienoyl-CoA reductase-like NADH-dependent reductase (Old Yellow Enzyme family)
MTQTLSEADEAPPHADLIKAIEDFVGDADMSEITFGRKAMSDPHFVRDLKNGRRIWPATEAKARGFIADYVASCGVCERRAEDPACEACVRSDCGLRQREAA